MPPDFRALFSTSATQRAEVSSYSTSAAIMTSNFCWVSTQNSSGTDVQSNFKVLAMVGSAGLFALALLFASAKVSVSTSAITTSTAPAFSAMLPHKPNPVPSSSTRLPFTKEGQCAISLAKATLAGQTTSPAPYNSSRN